MRTVTWEGNIRITRERMYRIEELPEKIQERAWMVWMESQEYPWDYDNRQSLKAFSEMFGVSVRDWSYGGGRTHISYDIPDWDLYQMRGIRLWKYLTNHYAPVIEQACPLTGYCMDEALLDPIRQFLKQPDTYTTMEDLVHEALWSWVYDCDRDFEWYYSYERFLEEADELGLLFTEDGNEWTYEPEQGR